MALLMQQYLLDWLRHLSWQHHGLGGGTTIPHAESTIEGQADEHYQTGNPAIQAAAGAELRILRHLYWMGEYKYTRTRQHVNVFSGIADTLLQTHHLVTGPVVHF